MPDERTRVTIVGGGVAALEALLALRAIAEERVEIELVAPEPEFVYRPLAVAEPFGIGEAHRYDLVRIVQDQGAVLHLAGVQAVAPENGRLVTWDGRSLDYEVLVLALGARGGVSIPGSVSIQGPGYTSRFRTVLRELEERRIRRVAFAAPAGASWPLPLYELALLTATRVREHGLRKVELSLVTPESEPLELFGSDASAAVRELLAEHDVALHTSRVPLEARDGELMIVPGESLRAERVVSLPRLQGPAVPGLPHDHEGFIPVDLHGRVEGLDEVYAAGDATTCPIKQGGVAAQQADAAAEAIAARAGAPVEPQPFRPVLRGLLLTGSTPRYLRAEVAGGRGEAWAVSEHALWWPPSKVAGRYLAPYLALRHGEIERPRGGIDVELDLGDSAVRRRAIIAPDPSGGTMKLPLAPGDG
jgi:sulfide:quinone oxidoreductase